MNARTIVSLALVLSAFTLAGCDKPVEAIEPLAAKSELSNPATCPAQPTSDMGEGLPCSLPAGTVCAYRVTMPAADHDGVDHGWQAFSCGCETAGVWSEASVVSPAECPDAPPETGTACDSTAIDAPCPYYPGTTSICTPANTWKTSPGSDPWVCASK